MLSYLPMCYMLERCCQLVTIMGGGRIGFYSGSMRNISTDMRDLRPTVLPSVPRVLNRLYQEHTGVARRRCLVRSRTMHSDSASSSKFHHWPLLVALVSPLA